MSGKQHKKFKIEPFKHPLKLDPNYAENTWKLLENAIKEINNHNASGLSYEELYRNAYNMVVNKYGERLYNGLVETETKHLQGVAARIEQAQGETLLRLLKEEWDSHNKSVTMIRDILMYMDRIYVKQHNKRPVHEIGLELWRQVVVRNPRIQPRLLDMLLTMIEKDRSGELVDRNLVRSMTAMLSDLGTFVYEEDFERPFLQRSSEFYLSEAVQYISVCDCPSYLAHAERRLDEEAERVTAYLDPMTLNRVIKVAETELITKQMRLLADMENSGAIVMLQNDKHDSLHQMYTLFKRVDGGAELLRDVMGNYIKSTGKDMVMDPERTKDPVEFVECLLQEKDKYDVIIATSFANDKSFQNMLNQSFEYFLNLNPRSPEYISLFMDEKLRKGLKGMNEDEVEAVLDKSIMLFRFLQEKDVFEKYYKQHLGKRLLSGRTTSDDAERSLIVKLKTECGYQFTSKLESMFTDIKTSRDTAGDFKGYLTGNGVSLGLDMMVQVLTTGSWPQSTTQRPCILPREAERCCEEFNKFYQTNFSGRRLTWQSGMGTAEIKATFGSKPHEINCSTHQMVVLMLFNEAEQLTFEEIFAATNIPEPELKRVLQSLACVKTKNVLTKEPMSKEIDAKDVFAVNDGFTSKLYKIKIGTVTAQKETDVEKAETRERVEEDRKPLIEAAIVRIMKARKVLSHNDIIAEVTRQLQQRFMPQPQVIKKRIESLIDRDYLERDATDRTLYRYVA